MTLRLILRERLCEPTFTRNLRLDGVAAPTTTESVAGDIYWRWEDETDMDPQFLGTQTAGHTLAVPFDSKGRAIRLYLISKTAGGVESVRDIKEAEQIVFEPDPVAEVASDNIEASEALVALNLVSVHSSSGEKVRKADATDDTRPADGFVLEDIASGNDATVFFAGNKISGLSGLTPGGILYLSETAGAMTHTPVSPATGKICQVVGKAISATEAVFLPQDPIRYA